MNEINRELAHIPKKFRPSDSFFHYTTGTEFVNYKMHQILIIQIMNYDKLHYYVLSVRKRVFSVP